MTRYDRFKRSAERFLKQVFHKPKAKISRGSMFIVVTMTLIFFAALIIRLTPLIDAQPLVRAFDPWFQLKVTDYVVQNGYMSFFSYYDHSVWIPFGRNIATTTYIGIPFTSAFFYWLANSLGINVSVLTVSILMPALMGALATIFAFFLGREVSNNTVGLLNALFMAFMPAYIQRSMVGFFDNEAIGVFAIVVILFFFVRSLKRDSARSGVAAGIALAYLLASWGASEYILGLLALYAFLMLIGGKYSRRLLTAYISTLSVGIFLGVLVPRVGFGNLDSITYLAAIGMGVLLATYEVWLRIAKYRDTTVSLLAPHMKSIALGLIAPVLGIVGYFIYATNNTLTIITTESNPFTFIGSKFWSVINPFFRLNQRIFASVAEHLPSPWGSFYSTLFVLVIFFPLGLYFAYRRGRDEDWLVLLLGVTAVYFTGSMIRLSLLLAPAAALLGAMAASGIITPFAKIVTQQSVFERKRFRMSSSLTSEHAIAAFAFVGLLLSVNVVLGTVYAVSVSPPEFAPAQISATTQVTDWQSAMTYLRNVLGPDATVASWWDYGYWLSGAGGVKTIVDGSTINSTQIGLMGYAMMALNLTESLKTFSLWNATDVLVYWGHTASTWGGDEGKWPWMVRIAEDNLGSSVITDKTYLGDNPSTAQVETEYTLNPFFQSTLYKLMLYGEPATYSDGQNMGLSSNRLYWDRYYFPTSDASGYGYQSDSRWAADIPTTLYGAFNLEFISYSFGLVKLYKIDYTMLHQYDNKTSADWVPQLDSLSGMSMDGVISTQEQQYTNYNVVFGGGYDATVYTRSNGTDLYVGISMANYTVGQDSFGIQIAPLGSTSKGSDLRIVNYDNMQNFDGHVDYYGNWVPDSTGANSQEFATGNKAIEFLIPLNSTDSQDLNMTGGMNYQFRLMFWNNVNTGFPTLDTDWTTIWAPVQLH
jgi:dolichyl-diphosphooligosaccharide--protein glycosyltransferase